jgi:membrane protein
MAESLHIFSQTTAGMPEAFVLEPGVLPRTWWLLKRSLIAAYEDNCFSVAKGAAYSFFLSLFPILTTLTYILVLANARSVVNVIAAFVQQTVPPGAVKLVLERLPERGAKPISLSVIAIVLALWAGSGAMISLMEGFQAAYRIPSGRPVVKQRAMAVFLVLIAAFPAVGASSLIIFGNRIETAVIHWIGVSDLSTPVQLAWKLSRYLVAFCTTTFVTGLLYYFGPNHRPEPRQLRQPARSRFMRVWPGAFLATILWLVTTAAFAWYVGHRLANYNIFYGGIGTVIILLIWLYLVACIALLGCEFNAERERIDSMPVLERSSES